MGNGQQAICVLFIAYCFLSLSLLEAGILFVNNIQLAFTTNDLAINAAFFNGCSYFHIVCFGLRALNLWFLTLCLVITCT
jgi:hypothetical protein